jgi:hypothetical protein
MNRKLIGAAVAGALSLAGSITANAQNDYVFRPGRAADWNVNAPDGTCRLRVWVDDKASVQLRGDQIIVNTRSGKRSFDQGSVCTQPLPFGRVEDFRVTAENARGRITDVLPPMRRNNFTGSISIEDPQNGGDTYDLLVSWHNADRPSEPIAATDPYPYFDETRACQDRVRRDFLAKNEGDFYLEFTGMSDREDLGSSRERIRGDGWLRNREESRPMTYECVLNDRTNRVLSSSYELRGRSRYSTR